MRPGGRFLRFLAAFTVCVCLTGCVTDAFAVSSAESGNTAAPQDSELTVHFLDVGQGDSTLIVCDDEAMLIDAGDNDQGTAVQSYLTKQGVERLKYVIGTHPDADHIGGLDVILYKFECDTVMMPEWESDTATYRDVIDAMSWRGYHNTPPAVGDTYTLGEAEFTVVSPAGPYDGDNDYSVAIVLRHGSNSFLFTGDAEEEAEDDIVNCGVDIDVDVYKAGHHGSSTSSGQKLLQAATPEYAVISCGEGNSYGHPHSETLNSLRAMGVKVYRTDEQGTITVTSDGSGLVWNCSPSGTWQAGEGTADSQAGERTVDSQAYILNTNTRKFHRADCSSVQQMAKKNKKKSSESRDVIIGWGYEPCKRCNP